MTLRAIVLVCGLAAASAAHAAGSGSYFRTSGQQILDTNGAAFLMRGMGLNGWLTPEAYQLQLNQVHKRHLGNASDIEQQVLNLLGTNVADAQAFWALYRTNYVTMSDLAMFKSNGLNTIRLPFNYRLLTPSNQPGVYRNEGFQMLSNIVDWCRSNNIGVILDLHCAPGGQSGDTPADPEYTYWAYNTNLNNWYEHGVACLWETNAAAIAATGRDPVTNRWRTIELWREIAKRFKDERQIIGYELLNEPFLPAGVHWPALRELLTNITAAIRSEDTNHIVFVEGNYYSGTFEGLFPAWDSNMVYMFHRYWSTATTANISTFIGARTSNNVPIVMGETGENSNPWFYQFKNVLESNNIGWCWWGWKKVDSVAGAYSAQVTTNYQYVINGFRDTFIDAGTVRKGLMEMATNLVTSRCHYEPGYFPALRNPNFDVYRTPYTNLYAPGFVPASDYDVGDQGTAYSDTRYKQEDGAGGAAWNSGWKYRNDGVDIYTTTSRLGNGYKIGGIAAGEYVRYTLIVPTGGTFEAVAQVGSPVNTGRIRLQLNGVNITANTTVPITGDYEAFTNLSLGNVTLPAATTNRLQITMSAGNYDMVGVWFVPTNRVRIDLGYHNNIAQSALAEQVPGTNNFGSFLQVNYATTTTTFYVLASESGVSARFNETGEVAIKVTYYHPQSNVWHDHYTKMSNVAQVVLDTTNAFHGLPAAGSTTTDVYRYDWPMPRGTNGAPLTNEIIVYYAPYFRTLDGSGGQTAVRFLANRNALFTNGYPTQPQLFDTNFFDADYAYTNRFAPSMSSADAPTFTPNGGTYTNSISVTLASTTPGATIYYTTNGTAPTTSSPSVPSGGSATLAQPFSNNVRAFAAAAGYADSGVSTSAVFAVVAMPVAGAPSFNPNGGTYTSSVQVALASTTTGVQVHYTTDGSQPTTNSPSVTNQAHITLAQPLTNSIRAFARLAGYQSSAIATSAVFIVVPMPVAAAPSFAPDGGTFTSAVQVTLSSATPGATIYYTTDGSAPGTNSPSATNGAAVLLVQPLTNSVRAFARASGHQDSAIATSAVFTVVPMPVAAAPSFAPDGGSFTGSVNVVLSSLTPGSTIHYTTDGSEPGTNSPSVAGGGSIPLDAPFTNQVRALAAASGFAPSAVSTSGLFTVVAPVDGDNDSMPDAWEAAQFGNLARDGLGDFDGDGASDLDEYIADTAPTNAASHFSQSLSGAGGATLVLTVSPSSTGRWYRVYTCTTLVESVPWLYTGVNSMGNGSMLFLSVTNASDTGHYNVRVSLP
jgi:endoglucanase